LDAAGANWLNAPMMNRRAVIRGLASFAAGMPTVAWPQTRQDFTRWRVRAWKKNPSIVVVGNDDDTRIPFVQRAVDFWNDEFAKLLISFRLGPVTHVSGMIPFADIQAVGASQGRQSLPESMERLDGDVIVALSNHFFTSFTFRSPLAPKALAAIEQSTVPGLIFIAIAHELGHVIGLGHNREPMTLMCGGGPASCRPAAGWPTPVDPLYFLRLAEADKMVLFAMYPPRLAAAAGAN
jgi:hypothetical protein